MLSEKEATFFFFKRINKPKRIVYPDQVMYKNGILTKFEAFLDFFAQKTKN